MKIQGTLTEIKRSRVKAPLDGIHRNSDKDGLIKGVHSLLWTLPDGTEKVVPKGMTGAYFRYKKDKGMKVFVQLPEFKVYKKRALMKDWKNRVRMAAAGITPKATKIVHVKLDLLVRGKRRSAKAWAIKMVHVHYPEDAWNVYASGLPYDFNCLDRAEHPLHTPEGYLAFARKVYKATKKLGITICGGDKIPKLGDIVYCTKTKRWWCVDCA